MIERETLEQLRGRADIAFKASDPFSPMGDLAMAVVGLCEMLARDAAPATPAVETSTAVEHVPLPHAVDFRCDGAFEAATRAVVATNAARDAAYERGFAAGAMAHERGRGCPRAEKAERERDLWKSKYVLAADELREVLEYRSDANRAHARAEAAEHALAAAEAAEQSLRGMNANNCNAAADAHVKLSDAERERDAAISQRDAWKKQCDLTSENLAEVSNRAATFARERDEGAEEFRRMRIVLQGVKQDRDTWMEKFESRTVVLEMGSKAFAEQAAVVEALTVDCNSVRARAARAEERVASARTAALVEAAKVCNQFARDNVEAFPEQAMAADSCGIQICALIDKEKS